MFKHRHRHTLMAAAALALSAGGTIAAAPADKITLVHAETAQECDFHTQGAADGFLASVADPGNWKAKGAIQLVDLEPAAAPQGIVVDVDLGALRTELASDIAAEDAAATTAAAAPVDPAPAPSQDPAPIPAAPAPEAPKATRTRNKPAAAD